MTARILVATTVHVPDDTRIRERLIRSLEDLGEVTYAARSPGPSDNDGLTWRPLTGGRLRRNLQALAIMLRGSWSLIVLHDPETIPAGALTRWLRRVPVVFDVHEDLPAQIASKSWIPVWARPGFRGLARLLYLIAGKTLIVTLAEPGYRKLFPAEHPVFPNYPNSSGFPEPISPGDGSAVYVGDITVARGLEDAAKACEIVGVPLIAIGGVDDELEERLSGAQLAGRLPHPEAMQRIAAASVGLSPLRDQPNYRDSLPTKTLEYLAMGVPVVASDLPGTRSVLDDLEAVWLVPPGDVAAMAAAITAAAEPAAKGKAVAQAKTVRERFAWPEVEVRRFYSDLLNRRGSPDPS